MLIESCEANLALYGAILDSLPKSVNRYSMWEAFLKKIKNSNPTEIYDSIRKFKTQREPKSNNCGNHSDSEGDDPNLVSSQIKTKTCSEIIDLVSANDFRRRKIDDGHITRSVC